MLTSSGTLQLGGTGGRKAVLDGGPVFGGAAADRRVYDSVSDLGSISFAALDWDLPAQR